MAENVQFIGVGKPESAKKRLVERVFDRVKNRLRQNTGEIVEKKWMDAYQRTIDATDSGMRKKALEKVRPLAWIVAKGARIATKVSDLVLQLAGMVDMSYGIGGIVKPQERIDSAKEFKQNVPNN